MDKSFVSYNFQEIKQLCESENKEIVQAITLKTQVNFGTILNCDFLPFLCTGQNGKTAAVVGRDFKNELRKKKNRWKYVLYFYKKKNNNKTKSH